MIVQVSFAKPRFGPVKHAHIVDCVRGFPVQFIADGFSFEAHATELSSRVRRQSSQVFDSAMLRGFGVGVCPPTIQSFKLSSLLSSVSVSEQPVFLYQI